MKRAVTLTIMISSISLLLATTFHTINIDGNNDFTADETFSTSSSGYTAYFTWDAENIYLGYSGADVGTGQSNSKWIVFYFDTDAHLDPKFGAGSLNAIEFNTQSWFLPFRADYMIQIRTTGGFEALKRFTGSSWVDVTPHNMQIFDNNSTNFIEIKLPRDKIGNPTKIYVLGYFLNETPMAEWSYASFPDNSLRGGDGYKNPGYFDHWYGFELGPNISPNAPANYDNKEFLKWDLRLSASITSLNLDDNNNFAGLALNATDGLDPNVDLPKPPTPPSNFIYLTFPHPEWGDPLGPNFYRDIRANRILDTSTISWDFKIITDKTNQNVTISVSEFNDVPANLDIFINDISANIIHNVRTQGNYNYNSGSGGERNFKLIVGKYVPNLFTVSNLNFGDVKLEYDSTRSFLVENIGLETLTISNLTITGNFTLVGASTPINIPAGGNTSLNVRFSPTELGNNSGVLTIFSNDPDSPEYQISLVGTGIKPTLTKTFSTGWNLVSLPLYPSYAHKDSIFGKYSSNYTLFNYQNGSYVSADSVFLGKGYWLGIYSPMNFSITGMPVMTDTLIDLNSAWNLISHVYLKDIRKLSLKIKRNTEVVSFDTAVNRNWIQSNIFGFNNSTNSYFTVDTLDQFNGYWLSALVDSLKIQFERNSTFGNPPKNQNTILDERNWLIYFSGQNSISRDNLFYLGLNENATSGFDNKFDNAKPPMLPNDSAIELYFYRNNWHPYFTKYYSDIRKFSLNEPVMTWDFVFYSKRQELSTIRWQNLADIFPPSILNQYHFILIDVTNNNEIDMKTQNVYQFNHNGDKTNFIFRFSKLTDVEESFEVKEFKLHQNYPNPFNPKTKIKFALPKSVNVNLSVYDAMGRELAILFNGKLEAGNYSIDFDASNLSSGVYFYKLTAGEFTDIKKMVLIK